MPVISARRCIPQPTRGGLTVLALGAGGAPRWHTWARLDGLRGAAAPPSLARWQNCSQQAGKMLQPCKQSTDLQRRSWGSDVQPRHGWASQPLWSCLSFHMCEMAMAKINVTWTLREEIKCKMKNSEVAGSFLIISPSIPSSYPSLLLITLSTEPHHHSHHSPSARRHHSSLCMRIPSNIPEPFSRQEKLCRLLHSWHRQRASINYRSIVWAWGQVDLR